jgi:glycosyltransferase involved in cell wall biosynthesis
MMGFDFPPVNACLGAETFVIDAGWLDCQDVWTMKILLVGNYLPDTLESMVRYAQLMHQGLRDAGHEVALAFPAVVLNRPRRAPRGVWKWIGYLDKHLFSVPGLRRAAAEVDIVHVCDQGNSVYVPLTDSAPHIVTCHDLLAVRGALGEETDCPASFAGRQLQRSILRGLRRAQALACVSTATQRDALRLLHGYSGQIMLTPNALNFPYRNISRESALARLAAVPGFDPTRAFVLNVGSNLRRKNRQAVLRAVAAVRSSWPGHIVFAGEPLSAELRTLAAELQLSDRVLEIVKPADEILEALYNRALALHFPSRFEGFGWPIIEAQACGCPVICSDREPLPEVAGGAAIMCDAEDFAALGAAIIQLERQPEVREDLRYRGLKNTQRYARATMIERFVSLYQQLAAAA